MKGSEIRRRLDGIAIAVLHGSETPIFVDDDLLDYLDHDTDYPVPATGWRQRTVPVPAVDPESDQPTMFLLAEGWEYQCEICAAHGRPNPGAVAIPLDPARDGYPQRPVYACRECIAAGATPATATDWPWHADRILDGGSAPGCRDEVATDEAPGAEEVTR